MRNLNSAFIFQSIFDLSYIICQKKSYNTDNLMKEKHMFSMPSGMELGIIVLVILLLFGGKKIPELAKGLGSGIKNFKNALNKDEDANEVTATATPVSTAKVEEKTA